MTVFTREELYADLKKKIDEFDWVAAREGRRQWVGLTEDEMEACFHHVYNDGICMLDFARAVETKLKEKNT